MEQTKVSVYREIKDVLCVNIAMLLFCIFIERLLLQLVAVVLLVSQTLNAKNC